MCRAAVWDALPSVRGWLLSLHWEVGSNLMSDLPIQSPPYSPPVTPVLNLSQIVLLISCFFEDQVLPFCLLLLCPLPDMS